MIIQSRSFRPLRGPNLFKSPLEKQFALARSKAYKYSYLVLRGQPEPGGFLYARSPAPGSGTLRRCSAPQHGLSGGPHDRHHRADHVVRELKGGPFVTSNPSGLCLQVDPACDTYTLNIVAPATGDYTVDITVTPPTADVDI